MDIVVYMGIVVYHPDGVMGTLWYTGIYQTIKTFQVTCCQKILILLPMGLSLGLWMLEMISQFVLFELLFPTCPIVTLVTRIFRTIMHRFLVSPKSALFGCLIITLVTRIFHTIMDNFYMLLK